MGSQSSWIIGSSSTCDIVVDDPHVAPRHCQLVKTGDGFLLIDLRSDAGTRVNGQRVVDPIAVTPRDRIVLADALAMPWPPEALASALPSGTKVSSIRPSKAPAQPSTQTSTQTSTQPPRKPAPVAAARPAATRPPPASAPVPGRLHAPLAEGALSLEAQHVTVEVPGRRLLDDVSLTIYAGEFVGLMGPSGAGKTTLMNALNGYSPPSGGAVLINGHDLYANYAAVSALVGYVPQDDIMHRELTVRQALYYTARLRLPAETTDAEIDERILSVAKQLGLEGALDTVIGSPERKGISGGQRKRVNLAMELLTDPAVLFLDEPTSGLSSEDALMVMKLLRQLADAGKAILLTIHQPSLEAYRLMDRLVVIAKDAQSVDPGRLAFYGPAYPDAIRFFNPSTSGAKTSEHLSPDELLRGLSQRPTAAWCDAFRRSRYFQDFVESRAERPPTPLPKQAPAVSSVEQWFTLLRRNAAIKLADRWNTAVLLLQAPIIALIVVLVFRDNINRKLSAETWPQITQATAITIFLLGLSALWFGCSNAVREIVGEWAIYHRERMVNLRAPAYVFAKLAVGAGLCALQCALLLAITRLGCSLAGPIISTFLVMMLVALVGVGIGLLLSAVARTSEVAIALLPLVLIPMVVFGGVLLPVYKMQAPIRVFAYGMPSRSGFEAMMLEEAGRRPLGPSPYSGTIALARDADDPDRPDMGENYFPRNQRLGAAASVTILAIMLVTLVTSIHLVLLARDVH